MKIFILGSTGMLGSHINWYLKNFYKPILITKKQLNASKVYTPQEFEKALPVKPNDVVINCIGILKPQIKSEPHCIKVNGLFPHALANYCNSRGAKVIHFSSDCVFNGERGSYTEVDIPDAEDIYGISKSMEPVNKAMVLRTSFIGQEFYHSRSLFSWLVSQEGGAIEGYSNCFWNGVTCISLAKIVSKILIENKFKIGLRHVFSPNTVSKLQLCKDIISVYRLNIKVHPAKAKEISGTKIKGKLDRSLSSVYSEALMPDYTILDQIKEQKCIKIQKSDLK